MKRTPPASPNESSAMKHVMIRGVVVLLLTAIFTAGAALMIGPQILIMVPAAMLGGIIFALRRSFLSLVCIGYPFTFGMVSAVIGWAEKDGFMQMTGFAISLAIGMVGVGLVATGLWKTLGAGAAGKTEAAAKERGPDPCAP